jgi:hypothetical protein
METARARAVPGQREERTRVITNMPLAAIGTTEWILIVMVAVMMVGVPVAALVFVWLWQRRPGTPSTRANKSDTHRGV